MKLQLAAIAPSGVGLKRSTAARPRSTRESDAWTSRRDISVLLDQVGASLVFFLLLTFALAVVVLATGLSLDQNIARQILFASLLLSALMCQRMFRAGWLGSLIVPALIAATSAALAMAVYDTSIDGQHYHFQAIYALSHGWNPFWSAGAPPTIGDPPSIWVRHYPAAAWLIEAVLLSSGVPLEATKGINMIALVASAFMMWGAMRALRIRGPAAVLLTAVATMNPVALSELFTRMNDGLLASCILIFVASGTRWLLRRERSSLFVTAAVLMLAVNLKFSAIPIFGVLSATAVIGAYLTGGRRASVETASWLLVAGISGVLLLGANPYVLNFLKFGHAFYPVMGNGSIDIMAKNTPVAIEPLSTPSRFLFSLFSETHAGFGREPQLKWPLSIGPEEIRAAGGVDTRLGGLGPLFSGALLLALAALVIAALRRRLKAQSVILLVWLAGICGSIAMMPENWWARYVPQLWLVPVLIAAAVLVTSDKKLKIGAICVAGIMLLNATMVATAASYLAAKRSLAVSNQITDLKRRSAPICVSAEYAQSRIAIFKASTIDVHSVDETSWSPCPAPIRFSSYGPDREGGMICPCDRHL